MGTLLVDPEVTRRKFELEVGQFRQREMENRRRGWFLLRADFPTVEILFVAAQLKPAPVAFGATFDFSNYDLVPPSVRVVDPLDWKPYTLAQLSSRLRIDQVREREVSGPGVQGKVLVPHRLMMAASGDEVPFLCLPGVREYHSNPAHTGDSWLLHRRGGEGTLFHLVESLHQFGVEHIAGFNLSLVVTGFSFHEGRSNEGILQR